MSCCSMQPEAVKAAISKVLAEPLENVGDALAGFKWEYEKVGRQGFGRPLRSSEPATATQTA
jgi:hypothetical protein